MNSIRTLYFRNNNDNNKVHLKSDACLREAVEITSELKRPIGPELLRTALLNKA
jgi:aspartyl/asparaginyl-tRNA synthetase